MSNVLGQRSVIKPPPLKARDRVALLSPASRPDSPAVVARAARIVENLGLDPVIGKNALSIHGYLSGTDEQRLADMQSAMDDPSIKAIFCLTGGYGSLRLIDKLDYSGLRKNPKIVLGSDENTSLLLAVHKWTDLVCLHGANLDCVDTQKAFDVLHKAVTDTQNWVPVQSDGFPEEFCYSTAGGVAEGRLLGGNLSAISSMMGTRHEPDITNSILFLEDKNERNDILDRWFTTLFVSGQLRRVRGVVIGTFDNCGPKGTLSMLSIEDTFGDRLKEMNIPNCFGLPIGQSSASRVIPIGVNSRLDADKGVIEFLEPALSW